MTQAEEPSLIICLIEKLENEGLRRWLHKHGNLSLAGYSEAWVQSQCQEGRGRRSLWIRLDKQESPIGELQIQ